MGEPGLPYRVRPLQVLLAVGAVLVVSAAGAVAGAPGGGAARVPLLALAVVVAGLAVGASWRGLRSTEESLAACAAGLALVAAWGGALPLLLVAAVFAVLAGLARSTAGWPLAAWLALQLAVLHGLGAVPGELHPPLFLAVALVGLAIALEGRRPVARAAFLTTVPWWLAGVLGGTATAWTGDGAARQLAALLVVAAAAGLLPARLRRDLDVFLGPPVAVPLLAGVVAGGALSGALAAFGTVGITAAGYVGVLVASTLPEFLRGWRRGLFRPVAVAGGSVMALAALAELSTRHAWGALVVLFVLTAAPTVLVAWRRPAERAGALPWALGCLAAAGVFAVPAGWLDPLTAAAVLTTLYAAGLAAARGLAEGRRTPTVVATAAAAVAGLLLVALQADREPLALALVAQGLVTVEWALWSGAARAWRIGASLATAGVLLAVSANQVHVLEEFTLPLAAGLLLAQGPRLVHGPSWPAWGPGLLVAAAPSAVMAVVLPGITRPVVVLAAAAVVMVLAGATGVRAPLVIGAATAVGTTLALALATLLWPVAAALLIGAGLLVVGARREQSPTPPFSARLAELR